MQCLENPNTSEVGHSFATVLAKPCISPPVARLWLCLRADRLRQRQCTRRTSLDMAKSHAEGYACGLSGIARSEGDDLKIITSRLGYLKTYLASALYQPVLS